MKVNLSTAFSGQDVGIKEVEDGIWIVSFLDYDLGYFDDEGKRVEPVANPFGPQKKNPGMDGSSRTVKNRRTAIRAADKTSRKKVKAFNELR